MKTDYQQKLSAGQSRQGACGSLLRLLLWPWGPACASPSAAATGGRAVSGVRAADTVRTTGAATGTAATEALRAVETAGAAGAAETAGATGVVRAFAAALLAAALLSGCSKDPLSGPGDDTPAAGGTVMTQITLTPEFMGQIDVKSVIGVREDVLKDVWVIQLNSAGTDQLQNPQFINEIMPSGSATYKIAVPLIKEASKVYFLANTHNNSLCTSSNANTAAKVEALTLDVTSEKSLVPNYGIPMSGMWSGTPSSTGIAGNVSLTRAIAKVTFNLKSSLPSGESFQLKSVQVKKVPSVVQYFRSNPASTPFPATSIGWYNYASATYDEVLGSTAKTLWWYLPENMRGTGSASDQQHKTAATAPSGQGDYCTYIEVSGTYTTAHWTTHTTTYRIFLGADNTKDYNLKRNTHYTVTTTILGQNISDTRITRTPENYLDYTDNGIPMFAVALSDLSSTMTWDDAMTSCPSGWRLPTLEELMLMWVYKGELGIWSSKFYWSSAEISFSDGTSYGWRVDFTDGTTYRGVKTSLITNVRCIRDL